MTDRPLRILHSEASLGFGGQERRILRELEGLDRSRFEGMLLCQPGSKLGEATQHRGIPTFRLRMRSSFDPLALVQIMRLLRRERIDVVHTHSSRDGWLVGAAGKFLGIPVFRTRHLRTRIGGPFVYARLADCVLTVSEDVRRYLVGEGVPDRQVIAVPTGINLKRFSPDRTDLVDMRARFGIPEDAPVIGIVAVLRARKGHRFLIEAFKRLLPEFPGLRLVIVGEGPQETNIRELISDPALRDRVTMAGTQADIPSLLKAFDLFVLPAQEEALGTALIEASAMGVPVIATNVGGIPEVLGDAGLPVPPEDVNALTDSMRKVLASPALKAQMRERGIRRARELFDEELMVRRTEQLYLERTRSAI